MNKKKYLKRLNNALKNAPRRDREQYVDYYSELIDDAIESGRRERDVIAELESPEAVAEQWLQERAGDDYVPPVPVRRVRRAEYDDDYAPPVPARRVRRAEYDDDYDRRDDKRCGGSGGGGTVVKAAFSPLLLIFGFIACVVGFVCIVVWTSLIVAFFAAALGLGVGGVFTIVMSFGLFAENIRLAILQIGVGIALCGVAAFMEVFVALLAKSYGAMWRFVWHRNAREGRGRRRGKSTLATAVLGLVLIIIGGGTFTALFGTLGFDYHNLAVMGEVKEETLDFSVEGVEAFALNSDSLSLTVKKSEDGAAKFVYNSIEKRPLTVGFEGGVLTADSGRGEKIFKNTMSDIWHYGIFYSAVADAYQDATLYLPESYQGALTLSLSNGNIAMESDTLGDVAIETKNGAVEIKGGNYGSLTLNTKNGAVSMCDLTADTLFAETKNGAVSAERISGREFVFATKNGMTKVIDVTGDKIEAKSSNGLVKIERIKADDIRLETSNGAIAGSIVGNRAEYQIDSHTSNGSNNLGSKEDGDKFLYAHTSNGAIKIEFAA